MTLHTQNVSAPGLHEALPLVLALSMSEVMACQGERIDDLKMIIGRTADAATLFDHDGISVRFMNSQAEGNNIGSPAEANNMLSQVCLPLINSNCLSGAGTVSWQAGPVPLSLDLPGSEQVV